MYNIGCIDEKWGMNKGNETKSEEEEDCKGRAHGDETRGGYGVQMSRRKIDEDENLPDVEEGWNEKIWSKLKFDIRLGYCNYMDEDGIKNEGGDLLVIDCSHVHR